MKTLIYELCRWFAVAAVVIFLVLNAGADTSANADPQTVLAAICNSADMTNMQPASHQIIKRLYGIDPAEYEFCALYYPLTNMDVDELLLVRYADNAQADALQKTADARLKAQKNVFESYGVGQMDMLTNHSFFDSHGGFALFAVNTKSDEIHAAFIKASEGK